MRRLPRKRWLKFGITFGIVNAEKDGKTADDSSGERRYPRLLSFFRIRERRSYFVEIICEKAGFSHLKKSLSGQEFTEAACAVCRYFAAARISAAIVLIGSLLLLCSMAAM